MISDILNVAVADAMADRERKASVTIPWSMAEVVGNKNAGALVTTGAGSTDEDTTEDEGYIFGIERISLQFRHRDAPAVTEVKDEESPKSVPE